MKRKPEASAKKGTNYVTIAGVSTYATHVTISTKKYVLSKKNIKKAPLVNPWDKMPSYLSETYTNHLIDKTVSAFGMNEKLHDWSFPS